MASWAIWYRNLVIAWAVLGLPSLVIGYGFSGGDLELPNGGVVDWAPWLLALFFVVSPFLLWSWRRTAKGRLRLNGRCKRPKRVES